MSKSGTLYTNCDNVRSFKILIAARYSNAKVDKSADFVIGETNKQACYLKKFPGGCVPAFQSTDGHCFSNCNAIAYYVANEALRGKTDVDAASVLEWTGFADNEILPHLASWVFDHLNVRKENKGELEKHKQSLSRSLAILDDYLRYRTYLVGDNITLADISCFTVLVLGFRHVFDEEFRKRFVNIERWFTTCVNQPEAKAVIGEVKFQSCPSTCSKSSSEQPKKEANKEEKKPKTAADEDEDEAEHKPAETDPFAQFPPGNFKMDDWKRTYSNNDFTAVSLPYFWQHFDKSAYTMWRCEYKFPTELTQVFMTMNLVTGMYQRLDRMRKHSFGVLGVFGVKNDNTIAGYFIWRGPELAFKLSEDLQVDYESYEWTKIDPESDEAKKAVEGYFGRKEETEFKGKKLSQFFVWK